MSASEKAFGLIKTVFTIQERFDSLQDSLSELVQRVSKLADSHAALRDRVSRIEGIIEGVGMAGAASRARQPRLPKS